MDFYPSVTALNAFSSVTTATASNIANVNTDGYKAMSVRLESGPDDRGVQVAAVYRDMTPGPAVIYNLSENDIRNYENMAARGMRNSQENYDTAQAQDVTRTQQGDAASAWYVQDIRAGQDSINRYHTGYIEGSNTDLPREFVNLIVTENAYSANAVAIRTMDEMTGSILNVKV